MRQPTRVPTPRSNATWIAELRAARARGTPSVAGDPDRTLTDLRQFLRATLGRLLGPHARVQDGDVDDFTQEALVRILEGLEGFRGDSSFTTWATAVAVRVAYGALRKRRFEASSLQARELDPEPAYTREPGAALDQESLLAALRHAIDHALTERQRRAILGELEGVPTSLLAEQLGTNPGALYKLHHDARKKLKRALEAAGFDGQRVRAELHDASERA